MNDVLQMPAAPTRSERWDRAGVAVSAACAVHCMLLPLVAGMLPLLGLQHFADERIELTLIAITTLIGVVGHTRAYRRHHAHIGPGLLFVIGLSMIVITRLSHVATVIEPVALGCGGVFAAAAHWMNLRLCRCCTAYGSGRPAER